MQEGMHYEKLPVYTPELDYIIHFEKRSQYKQVSRDVAMILDMPLKKCRKIMQRNAPGYILDYDNLQYWNGEVPTCILEAFGDIIITVSVLAGSGHTLKQIYTIIH